MRSPLGSLCTLTVAAAAAVSSLLSAAYGFIDDHSVYMHSPATTTTATASTSAGGKNVPSAPL